ncbi:Hypothetical protein GbCGDNIH3_1360 [Granulibacter bethesdensis]|uniref:Uncharacterized protein n=2 Tax=Granulibacter bethesdensis TaxID=364410 RepID=A0AAN0RE28_9PROT|nr:Hypothetical protein GbCGDNIH3_1360 [Granulibacter bethesdensis]APH59691.1 Hypothetical protein GbCGDNIH7_1360 [Granulibacter bethesdensis]
MDNRQMHDDDLPRPPTGSWPLILDPLGIDELRDYIVHLKAEILRVEQAIARREAHRGGVEAIFKGLGPNGS